MRFLLFLALLAAHPLLGALNRDVTIEAIGLVETGGVAKIGAHHERGVYQMTPPVCARVGGYDKAAALRWLDVICSDLARYGVDVNVFNVALCWNTGAYRATHGKAPVSSYQYAVRVSNVYFFLLSQRRPAPIVAKPIHFSLTPPMFSVSFQP